MARQADHNRAGDLISAYLDQQVTAEEKQFFERHIAACADCRAQLEATRSMVAALKAMPVVKAPRSFVLPREMARQPKRSIFAWYPTLRLATALAAIAFVVLFAGDLLISRSGGGGAALSSVPMAAPAPQLEQATESMPAPAATTIAQAAPSEAPVPAAGGYVATEVGDTAAPPAAAGTAAKFAATETVTLTDATAAMLAGPTATPEMTAVAAVQPTLEATPAPAAEAQAERSAVPVVEQPVTTTAAAPTAQTIDPLRVIELALLGLVIVLGAAMLIARRKQV
jgi:predicted anti-sigma-YlaC factor YlaD